MEKKLTELLKKSEEPFYDACKVAEQLEKDFERVVGYLNFLGIDPMDGTPNAEVVYAMRIQGLQRNNKELVDVLEIAANHYEDLGYLEKAKYCRKMIPPAR